jgi:hypothetical protein
MAEDEYLPARLGGAYLAHVGRTPEELEQHAITGRPVCRSRPEIALFKSGREHTSLGISIQCQGYQELFHPTHFQCSQRRVPKACLYDTERSLGAGIRQFHRWVSLPKQAALRDIMELNKPMQRASTWSTTRNKCQLLPASRLS